MKKFEIVEIDKDYNAWVNTQLLEFETREDAEKYARDISWSGSYYYVGEEF